MMKVYRILSISFGLAVIAPTEGFIWKNLLFGDRNSFHDQGDLIHHLKSSSPLVNTPEQSGPTQYAQDKSVWPGHDTHPYAADPSANPVFAVPWTDANTKFAQNPTNFLNLVGADFQPTRLVNIWLVLCFTIYMIVCQGYYLWTYGITFRRVRKPTPWFASIMGVNNNGQAWEALEKYFFKILEYVDTEPVTIVVDTSGTGPVWATPATPAPPTVESTSAPSFVTAPAASEVPSSSTAIPTLVEASTSPSTVAPAISAPIDNGNVGVADGSTPGIVPKKEGTNSTTLF